MRAWRRTWARHAVGLALSGGGATSFAGCGSVAGPEYTGEVGLELRGQVEALGEGKEELVPVLGFLTNSAFHLMDAELTGEYPKQFTMRVDQAPPEEALLREGTGGVSVKAGGPERLGMALLMLVPKDHPPIIEFENGAIAEVSSTSEDGEPDPTTGEFIRTERRCSKDEKQCETTTFSCRTEACETVLVEELEGFEGSVSGFSCQAGACLTYNARCQGPECSRTIYHCEGGGYDRGSSDGTVDRCTLASREGGPVGESSAELFAHEIVVIFASESADYLGVHVEAGYNVLRRVEREDKRAWAEALACSLDARQEVWDNAGDSSQEEKDARLDELMDQCPRELIFERL